MCIVPLKAVGATKAGPAMAVLVLTLTIVWPTWACSYESVNARAKPAPTSP